jgi:TBC1 domain family protein 5
MPEDQYFRQPVTQQMLLDILFIYCKLNQDVGYRQGMHELLAPILFVVERDAIDSESGDVQSSMETEDSLIQETLDARYIEHDAFTIFSLLMQHAKSFYELGDSGRKEGAAIIGIPSTPGQSPIVERSKRIHEHYLAKVDPELAKHLTEIEILPQIFLM